MPRKSATTRVVEALGFGGRSEAYRWLWENYDAIMEARIRRFSWRDAREEMVRSGAVKNPPTADALRKTFGRVIRDKAKAPAPREPRILSGVELSRLRTAEMNQRAQTQAASDIKSQLTAGRSLPEPHNPKKQETGNGGETR